MLQSGIMHDWLDFSYLFLRTLRFKQQAHIPKQFIHFVKERYWRPLGFAMSHNYLIVWMRCSRMIKQKEGHTQIKYAWLIFRRSFTKWYEKSLSYITNKRISWLPFRYNLMVTIFILNTQWILMNKCKYNDEYVKMNVR